MSFSNSFQYSTENLKGMIQLPLKLVNILYYKQNIKERNLIQLNKSVQSANWYVTCFSIREIHCETNRTI